MDVKKIVVLFLTLGLASCTDMNGDPSPGSINWTIREFSVDNEGVVFKFKAAISKDVAMRVAECGFYYGKDKSFQDADKIITKITGVYFDTELTLNDYGASYYVAPYISNGKKELLAEAQVIEIGDFASYVNFSWPIQKVSEDGSSVIITDLSISKKNGVDISESGVVYIKTQNVDAITTLGEMVATEEGSVEITGLEIGNDYSYCQYAMDGDNIAYGKVRSFNSTGYSSVETTEVRADFESVYCKGTLISDGGDDGAKCGFVWSKTEQYPEYNDINIQICTINDGVFEANLVLEANTNYYIRTFCKNSRATTYGDVFYITTQKGRYISLSNSDVTFDAYGNLTSEAIKVDASVAWEVFDSLLWGKVTPAEGEAGETELSIVLTENDSLHPRSAIVNIYDKENRSVVAKLTVIQSAVTLEDMAPLECVWNAETLPFEVQFPGLWQAWSSDDWIKLSITSGKGPQLIDILVDENTLAEERKGVVNFWSQGFTFELEVYQSGQYLMFSELSELEEQPANATDVEVMVLTSVGKLPSIVYGEGHSDWITFEENSEGGYTLHLAANHSIAERTATFVVKATAEGADQRYLDGVSCEIVQKGRSISVGVEELNFNSSAQTSSVYAISADGSYEVSKASEDEWYSLYHDYSNNTFYVMLTANDTESARRSVITISLTGLPKGEEYKVEIPITQKRKYGNIDLGDWGEDENWDL